MATVLRMPEVLANATEAVLSTWEVPEGATVAVGDVLAEIETEKAVVELAAEEAGVLARQLAAPGERVAVGAPVALLLAHAGEEVDLDALLGAQAALAGEADLPADDPGAVARVAPGGSRTTVHAEGVSGPSGTEPAAGPGAPTADGRATGGPTTDRPTTDATAPQRQGAAAATVEPSTTDGARVFASPLARKKAREAGLDVASLTGTGPGGRVVRRDVERALAAAPSGRAEPGGGAPTTGAGRGGAPAPTGGDQVEVLPHTPMRRAIARRLTESASTVPHFFLTAECRLDRLLALRAEVNAAQEAVGGPGGSPDAAPAPRVSVTDLLVKAVAVAYRAVPDAAVVWTEDALLRHRQVDVALAVATEGGLVTPVVRDVGGLTVGGVAARTAELVARARAGRLRQDELEGGVVSVSNLGMYGTREFSAILNPPQSMILAVGAAAPQPVVEDGEVRVATVLRCTVSVDHRAVDGALAAQWLRAFQAAVENPVALLV